MDNESLSEVISIMESPGGWRLRMVDMAPRLREVRARQKAALLDVLAAVSDQMTEHAYQEFASIIDDL